MPSRNRIPGWFWRELAGATITFVLVWVLVILTFTLIGA